MPSSPEPQSPAAATTTPDELQPVAAVLAILLPGAGHVYLGHVKRGILAGAGILGLFFGGLFIAGLDAVDRRENFVWFIGQALVGPIAFGVDYVHQNHFKVVVHETGPDGRRLDRRAARPDEIMHPVTGQPVRVRDAQGNLIAYVDPITAQMVTPPPDARPPYVQSIGRANELGTLFSTIAGMMNLICILDAAYSHRRERKS